MVETKLYYLETIDISGAHADTLVIPPSDVHKIDGCSYELRFLSDGNLMVGCQIISPAGQLQAFKLLGAKLGYAIKG